LLAFDTATPFVTVALHDGETVVAEARSEQRMRHGEQLAPLIDGLLRGAGLVRQDLTALAVGTGPGPFTGLRVGLVTARTLGAALSIPVLGICTLDTLALAAEIDEEFRVVTDARRKEVHWASYRPGPAGPERVDGPCVAAPADAAWDGPAVGAGAELYADAFPGHRAPLHPRAADLARWVARDLPTSAPDPLYLRRPDAVEPAARKPVSGR